VRKSNPHTDHSADVVVIGAGVVGLTIAWRAAQAGMQVTLLDAEAPGAGASSVAAGMLAPVTEADFGEAELVALNVEAARGYPRFVAEIEDATGMQTGYRACGTLAVATDRDELEILERLHGLQSSLGLAAQRLTPREARTLEPGLAPRVAGGVHAPDDHQVTPRAVLSALVAAFEQEGGTLRSGERVAGIDTAGDRVSGIAFESGERIECAAAVIAAGCWSGQIAGISQYPVRPVKGQILRLGGPADESPLRCVVRTPEVYVVPRANGRVVVGATVEEQGFDRSVTAGGVLELLRRAYEVVPQIAELELIETAAGLRPTTPDGGPLIGPGDTDGLLWASGHWRNGVLLAPLTAEAIVSALRGEKPSPLAAAFAPGRFAGTQAVR